MVDPCEGKTCPTGQTPTPNASGGCDCVGKTVVTGCGDKTCPGNQVLNSVTCKCENSTNPFCEELKDECAKLALCADCNTMQCVTCPEASPCDDPTYAADNLCECYPNHPECVTEEEEEDEVTPGGGGGVPLPDFVTPARTPGLVTEEAAELAEIGPRYDIGSSSIFQQPATPVEETDDLDFLDLQSNPFVPYNRGGIVRDYAINTLIDILRNK